MESHPLDFVSLQIEGFFVETKSPPKSYVRNAVYKKTYNASGEVEYVKGPLTLTSMLCMPATDKLAGNAGDMVDIYQKHARVPGKPPRQLSEAEAVKVAERFHLLGLYSMYTERPVVTYAKASGLEHELEQRDALRRALEFLLNMYRLDNEPLSLAERSRMSDVAGSIFKLMNDRGSALKKLVAGQRANDLTKIRAAATDLADLNPAMQKIISSESVRRVDDEGHNTLHLDEFIKRAYGDASKRTLLERVYQGGGRGGGGDAVAVIPYLTRAWHHGNTDIELALPFLPPALDQGREKRDAFEQYSSEVKHTFNTKSVSGQPITFSPKNATLSAAAASSCLMGRVRVEIADDGKTVMFGWKTVTRKFGTQDDLLKAQAEATKRNEGYQAMRGRSRFPLERSVGIIPLTYVHTDKQRDHFLWTEERLTLSMQQEEAADNISAAMRYIIALFVGYGMNFALRGVVDLTILDGTLLLGDSTWLSSLVSAAVYPGLMLGVSLPMLPMLRLLTPKESSFGTLLTKVSHAMGGYASSLAMASCCVVGAPYAAVGEQYMGFLANEWLWRIIAVPIIYSTATSNEKEPALVVASTAEITRTFMGDLVTATFIGSNGSPPHLTGLLKIVSTAVDNSWKIAVFAAVAVYFAAQHSTSLEFLASYLGISFTASAPEIAIIAKDLGLSATTVVTATHAVYAYASATYTNATNTNSTLSKTTEFINVARQSDWCTQRGACDNLFDEAARLVTDAQRTVQQTLSVTEVPQRDRNFLENSISLYRDIERTAVFPSLPQKNLVYWTSPLNRVKLVASLQTCGEIAAAFRRNYDTLGALQNGADFNKYSLDLQAAINGALAEYKSSFEWTSEVYVPNDRDRGIAWQTLGTPGVWEQLDADTIFRLARMAHETDGTTLIGFGQAAINLKHAMENIGEKMKSWEDNPTSLTDTALSSVNDLHAAYDFLQEEAKTAKKLLEISENLVTHSVTQTLLVEKTAWFGGDFDLLTAFNAEVKELIGELSETTFIRRYDQTTGPGASVLSTTTTNEASLLTKKCNDIRNRLREARDGALRKIPASLRVSSVAYDVLAQKWNTPEWLSEVSRGAGQLGLVPRHAQGFWSSATDYVASAVAQLSASKDEKGPYVRRLSVRNAYEEAHGPVVFGGRMLQLHGPTSEASLSPLEDGLSRLDDIMEALKIVLTTLSRASDSGVLVTFLDLYTHSKKPVAVHLRACDPHKVLYTMVLRAVCDMHQMSHAWVEGKVKEGCAFDIARSCGSPSLPYYGVRLLPEEGFYSKDGDLFHVGCPDPIKASRADAILAQRDAETFQITRQQGLFSFEWFEAMFRGSGATDGELVDNQGVMELLRAIWSRAEYDSVIDMARKLRGSNATSEYMTVVQKTMAGIWELLDEVESDVQAIGEEARVCVEMIGKPAIMTQNMYTPVNGIYSTSPVFTGIVIAPMVITSKSFRSLAAGVFAPI